MSVCKNNKTRKNNRSYKGTEPSPKGLGYCAHNEKINKQMKGKDGNFWKVKKTLYGTRRWVKISKTKKNR